MNKLIEKIFKIRKRENTSFDEMTNLPKNFRDELKDKIESLGGKVTGSVSAKCECLINNDVASTSSKNKKAKELGVRIISEEDFNREYLGM